MLLLSKEDIIQINKATIEVHGGTFIEPLNFKNEGSLEYLVEAVGGSVFGKEMYPSLPEKAGYYLYSINSGHIFIDGNKRTGLGAALLFLRINSFRLKDELIPVTSDDKSIPAMSNNSMEHLIEFVLEVASGKVPLEICQKWFEINITSI